ncbi:MAG: 16S rRNA (cytidine(1402)-2'-O)-methyltransferase, partial [Thermoleophilia bacterium]|nr:16S rRNA (cytidine(1402)-2'-O)-methyltransferase [Thermoleophilia bacterium]
LGQSIALVSDAGTPAVNDPGVALVAAAHEAGIEVVAVPGPSAVSAAVSIAGFSGAGYHFAGFLPRGGGDLRALLADRSHELLVAFEGPSRIVASLAVVADCQPTRHVAVCRELTKLHEEVVRGTAIDVLAHLTDGETRGEFVVVLAPLELLSDDAPATSLAFALELEAEGVRLKRACSIAADRLGGTSNALYDAALAARGS